MFLCNVSNINVSNIYACICHGRKSNVVEFQILPVESPMVASDSRKSSWTDGRFTSELGDLGIALGSEI